MKLIIKQIIALIVYTVSYCYSIRTNEAVTNFKNYIYSIWIKGQLKSCGKNVRFQAPSYFIGVEYISIGDNFRALDRFRLECWDGYAGVKYNPKIKIANRVGIGYNVHIACINEITIGENVLMGSNIFITDHMHGFIDERDANIPPLKRNLFSKGSVHIGNNVWIGENSTIMPNVIIGENAIIGANSVVTKNVPPFSVVAGNPARIIKCLI